MENDDCLVRCVDQQRVARVLAGLPESRAVGEAAQLFKLLADPNRLRLMLALAREELCVCDLSELVDTSASAVSHQLRLLRTARLVRSRREGKMVYYRLDDDHVERLLGEGLNHVAED